MAGVVARSPKLSEIFGSSWSFGQMSTVMRCKMSMVHEFELGMISMVDLKHKVKRWKVSHEPVRLSRSAETFSSLRGVVR